MISNSMSLPQIARSTQRTRQGIINAFQKSRTFSRFHSTKEWPSWRKKSGNVLDELERRGLVKDVTSSALRKHLDTPRVLYLGIDPTAASLHIGHFLQLSTLRHFHEYGHQCILVIGGGTGQVGDPTGRREERVSLKTVDVEENVRQLQGQVRRLLKIGDVGDVEGLVVRNNVEWLGDIRLLEFLRDVGKERMSRMLARESVKTRLATGGLSFTEFTYQLLQAYDYLHLHRHYSCSLQLGGSDQYGNIMSGVELIMDAGGEAYGITTHLLTDSKGEKWGKSKGKAVWLDEERTSPMEFFEFLRKTSDENVGKMLKMFSTIHVDEVDHLLSQGRHSNLLQDFLAANMTVQVHGESGLKQARLALSLRSSKGEALSQLVSENKKDIVEFSNQGLTFRKIRREDLIGQSMVNVLCSNGLVGFWESRTQMLKELGGGKSLLINGQRVEDVRNATIDKEMLMDGSIVVFSSGQKIRVVVS